MKKYLSLLLFLLLFSCDISNNKNNGKNTSSAKTQDDDLGKPLISIDSKGMTIPSGSNGLGINKNQDSVNIDELVKYITETIEKIDNESDRNSLENKIAESLTKLSDLDKNSEHFRFLGNQITRNNNNDTNTHLKHLENLKKELESIKQKQALTKAKAEAQLEKERQVQLEKERQVQLEKERQVQLEKERQVQLEKERQVQLEKERAEADKKSREEAIKEAKQEIINQLDDLNEEAESIKKKLNFDYSGTYGEYTSKEGIKQLINNLLDEFNGSTNSNSLKAIVEKNKNKGLLDIDISDLTEAIKPFEGTVNVDNKDDLNSKLDTLKEKIKEVKGRLN